MYVSQETPAQTHARLVRDLAEADLVVFSEPYAFVEVSVEALPAHLATQALAFVRDEDVWSALVPTPDPAPERFVLFSFHFTPGLDNSGFVAGSPRTSRRPSGPACSWCAARTPRGAASSTTGVRRSPSPTRSLPSSIACAN